MLRLSGAVLAGALLLGGGRADEDIILPPLQSDLSLPERLLVFLPGGLVPNEHYRLTGQAIQNATTHVRLTVVIPQVFQRLCIITCPNSTICAPLKSRIDDAVSKSGFKSTDPSEDTFVAGHSLGTICANSLAQGYSYEFAGLLEFGGYVDPTGEASVANYTIPVLHMSGELDGGSARVSSLAGLYAQSMAYASAHSLEAALARKPVQILEGLDHSDFCPGFFVTKTKDCKSEVAQDVALHTIGEVAAAFLHLNTPTPASARRAAMDVMKKRLAFTKEMAEPFLVAFQLEGREVSSPPAGVPAGPWCNVAQHVISGLSPADAGKLKAAPCRLVTGGLGDFEHQHTSYTVLPDGSLEVSCVATVEPASHRNLLGSLFSATSVDCKMVDAGRVAQQLKVRTNSTVSCADINRQAADVARQLLPAKSLRRYEQRGRGVCLLEDAGVPGNVGPLWLYSAIRLQETEQCLEVTSRKLVTGVHSPIYPGSHYCKLLSPAAAMDWMMTDSHKPFPYPSESPEASETLLV